MSGLTVKKSHGEALCTSNDYSMEVPTMLDPNITFQNFCRDCWIIVNRRSVAGGSIYIVGCCFLPRSCSPDHVDSLCASICSSKNSHIISLKFGPLFGVTSFRFRAVPLQIAMFLLKLRMHLMTFRRYVELKILLGTVVPEARTISVCIKQVVRRWLSLPAQVEISNLRSSVPSIWWCVPARIARAIPS